VRVEYESGIQLLPNSISLAGIFLEASTSLLPHLKIMDVYREVTLLLVSLKSMSTLLEIVEVICCDLESKDHIYD